MKRFVTYRNIRQKALIYGLPLPLFALMMLSVIGSLLVIIFSFSLLLITGAILFNLILYFLLMQLTLNPQLLSISRVFPQSISNKQSTQLNHEN